MSAVLKMLWTCHLCPHLLSLPSASTLAILSLLEQTADTTAPGPLHLHFPVQSLKAPSFSSGRTLFSCYLLKRQILLIPHTPVWNTYPINMGPFTMCYLPFDHLPLSDIVSFIWWVGVCFLPLDCQLMKTRMLFTKRNTPNPCKLHSSIQFPSSTPETTWLIIDPQ